MRKRAHSGKRWQELLDTATAIFYDKGFPATSIQDIADAMGVLKGSLYYYIESKEDLLYELLYECHQDFIRQLEGYRRLEGPADERLREMLRQHIVWNTQITVRLAVFYRDFRYLSAERQRPILATRDEYERFLRDLLEEGQADGTITAEADPKLAALALFSMANWLYQWYRPHGELTPSQVADEFVRFALHGLAADPRTGSATQPARAPRPKPRTRSR